MTGLDTEILLSAAYALFLLVVAICLELAARHSHRRSEHMRVAGFRYDPRADLWTCPNNQKLFRAHADYERRTVFYRAAAHTCNSCPIKSRCTDSDDGRVVERRPDSWLDSELRRFHRGISLALVMLSAVLLTAQFVRYASRYDRMVTGALLAFVALYGIHIAGGLVRPSGNLVSDLEKS
jgi:hypothetical protein